MSPLETGMYFLLGLSVSAVIAMLALRGVWRAGIATGQRRSKKAAPSEIAELRAERDQLRAERAMGARKLELRLSELKTRLAEQMGEVSRTRNRIDHMANEVRRRDDRLAARDAEIDALKQMIVPLEEELAARSDALDGLREELRRRDDRIAQLDSELAFVKTMHTQERLGRAANGERAVQFGPRKRAAAPLIDGGVQDKIATLTALANQIETQRQELQRQQRELTRIREALPEGDGDGDGAPDAVERQLEDADKLGDITADLERQLAQAEAEAGALQDEVRQLNEAADRTEIPAPEPQAEPEPQPAAAARDRRDAVLSAVPGEPVLSDPGSGEAEDTRGYANVVTLANRIRALQKDVK